MIAAEPDDIDDMLDALLRMTDCDRSGDLAEAIDEASAPYSAGERIAALALTLAALVETCPNQPVMLAVAMRLAERYLRASSA